MASYAPLNILKYLAETLAIAAAYVVTAKLGFLFAIAPGNVTALWPPSGIALAAVIHRGNRAALGVWLGSFLVNSLFFAQVQTLSVIALTTASSIATGSMLQVLLAASLYWRFIGPGIPEQVKDVIKFLGIAALSCSVAPSVGVSSLAIGGAIPWSNYPYTWLTWWLGDLAGILTVTPPLLVIGRSTPRRALAFPLLGWGVALTLITFFTVLHLERQALAARFQRAAEDIVSSVRRSIELGMHNLESIAAFYAGSREIERDEFRRFALPLLAQDPSLKALSWAPRVPAGEREEYEQAARREGHLDFQFTEFAAGGQLVRAALREEYFPVYFIEPLQGNEAALGFDLASEPTRREALNQVRKTGKSVATAPIRLLQETGEHQGFVIFRPIYHGHGPADALIPRPTDPLGIASAVFQVGILVEGALKYLKPQGVDVYLFDMSLPQSTQLLHVESSSRNPGSSAATAPDAVRLQSGLHHRATLEVGGRQWLILCKPGRDYLGAERAWLPWSVLLVGVLFTALLVVYLEQSARGNAALREAKSQFEDLYENAPDMYVSVDAPSSRILRCNRTLALATGYTKEEIVGRPIFEMYPPDCIEQAKQAFHSFVETGHVRETELQLKCKDGSAIDVSLNVSPVRDERGQILYSRSSWRDITDQKRMEREIRQLNTQLEQRVMARTAELHAALQEKTVLLNEVHHRVKNNLQVISSLLSLQAAHTENPAVQRVLTESQGRVKAMALIHQLLYERKDFSRVQLGEYLDRLAHLVLNTYAVGGARIAIKADVADLSLDLQRAIACGLLVNELLTNAIKHAFPGGRAGQVCIELKEMDDHEAILALSDNGVGLPEGFSLAGGKSLGLQLVALLADQIGAALSIRDGPGARFELHFKPLVKS
jgi:PAS domain S-box-containing protein